MIRILLEHDIVAKGDVMEIIVETVNKQLAASLSDGTQPYGLSINVQSIVTRRSAISPEVITFAITIGTSIATNIISTWLYEKLKEGTKTLYINRKETGID